MKFSTFFVCSVLGASTAAGFAIPEELKALSLRDALPFSESTEVHLNALERRKGGGGGGGGGRAGGSSSSGSSSSGSSSSSSGSSGGKGSSAGTSSTSNSGGRSPSGSGVAPSFGRGSFYGGGASVPYRAGGASPLGIAPFLFAGTALIGVAALSGAWLYGVYSYPYHQPIVFNNVSAANATNPNGVNQTHPVDCLCQQYSECGCDDNNNSTYIDSLLGNGSYNALNHSLVAVSDNGTIYINGTLPNGTTAAGGTSAAGHIAPTSFSGYLFLVTIVAGIVLST